MLQGMAWSWGDAARSDDETPSPRVGSHEHLIAAERRQLGGHEPERACSGRDRGGLRIWKRSGSRRSDHKSSGLDECVAGVLRGSVSNVFQTCHDLLGPHRCWGSHVQGAPSPSCTPGTRLRVYQGARIHAGHGGVAPASQSPTPAALRSGGGRGSLCASRPYRSGAVPGLDGGRKKHCDRRGIELVDFPSQGRCPGRT